MDEPTHANESRFWNQVADWLLAALDRKRGPLTEDEIRQLLGERKDSDS